MRTDRNTSGGKESEIREQARKCVLLKDLPGIVVLAFDLFRAKPKILEALATAIDYD